MAELAVVALPNGQFSENCYLLADQESGGAVMVDPGEESSRFLSELDRRGWRLEAVWLTHAHVDHIMGVGAVKAATGVPVLLHPADRPLYDALPRQGEWMGLRLEAPPPPDAALADGQKLRLGPHTFTVRHTPGHSPGSVSFVTRGRVFGGDVLFSGSIGRTDLPGGDYATLINSIQSVFLPLPDSTVVHSGHGPDTTVGVERVTNPFLVGASRLG
jgi:glyoxylase-like metal-dependent hydrolase (beta-lactamase superfamily II)